MDTTGQVQVATFTTDFQQLLCDLGVRAGTVLVSAGDPAAHREEWLELTGDWGDDDWRKVQEFIDSILHDRSGVPPLVVEKHLLRDGYHRLAALFLLGIDRWPIIYLEQQSSAAGQACDTVSY